MSVTATLLINFDPKSGGSDAASGHLSAEIDSRPTAEGGHNDGKTTFQPGDDVYFFVYASSNVTYTPPVASAGRIVPLASETVTRTDDVVFPKTNTASLPVPATALTSFKWLGNPLGDLTLLDEMTLQADNPGVAVARVTFTAEPDVYKLVSPDSVAGETDYTILIYIEGEVTG